MSELSKYTDNDLIDLNKKLTAQLVAVNCEIQKRETIKKMKHNLQGELDKINANGLNEIKQLSSFNTCDTVAKPSKLKKQPKSKDISKEAKQDIDKYRSWTVKKMQIFLDSKRVEYKKSINREDLIKTIQGRSLVREMNSYA